MPFRPTRKLIFPFSGRLLVGAVLAGESLVQDRYWGWFIRGMRGRTFLLRLFLNGKLYTVLSHLSTKKRNEKKSRPGEDPFSSHLDTSGPFPYI
jgi:hypothetical protein